MIYSIFKEKRLTFFELVVQKFTKSSDVKWKWKIELKSVSKPHQLKKLKKNRQTFIKIEKPRPDVLTLSTTFCDLTVSRKVSAKAEMRQFDASATDGLKRPSRQAA